MTAAAPTGLPPTLSSAVLAPLCQRYGISRLAVFGSRLKGTQRPDSDLDLLVEFQPDRVPGLIGLAAMAQEFSQTLGLPVDLRTPGDLSRHFRQQVLNEAWVAYAA